MTVPLRVLLIVILWMLCWAGMRSLPSGSKPAFSKAPATAQASADPLLQTETINPAQGLPMVHVAALAQTPDGILHAVWYGGTAECHPDVKIYLSEKEPGGHWTAPRAIMTREQAERDLGRPVKAVGNALLIAEADGSLRLLFVTISMGKWSGSQLNSSVSNDDGMTWSPAKHLTLSPFFNLSELVRNRPLPLDGGGWCVPIYQEFLGKFPELLWLGSNGSYLKSRIAGGCTSFQPSVIPIDDSKAVALLRDYTDDRKIFRSFSDNSGNSWSRPAPTSLPNPDAGVSGLLLSDHRMLAAFNNSPKNRSDLSLSITPDEGMTWSPPISVEQEAGASFSYPYLLHSADGLIRLAYTWKGRELRLITLNESWLNSQTAPTGKP
jgi:predicted neuraminidase